MQDTAAIQITIAQHVEAYEAALVEDPTTELDAFVPPADHPQSIAVLVELIRVDLEWCWSRGHPRSLAHYRRRYPAAFGEEQHAAVLAFEEYRQRRRCGDSVTPEEYRTAYGVDTSDWPSVAIEPPSAVRPMDTLPQTMVVEVAEPHPTTVVDVRPDLSQTPSPAHGEPPRTVARSLLTTDAPEESVTNSGPAWVPPERVLPTVGSQFMGFRLEAELGRGAFGRVFLARQGDLGGRPVALKVASNIFGESQTLAQLQHTNIVPIYSYHRSGPLQAVCMPYFGRTTLADVVKSLSGRPSLPSSGRELRSTVGGQHDVTNVASTAGPSSDPNAPMVLIAEPVGALTAERSSTPDGWTRLEGLSYVEAVLWLGSELAAGLAHAHDRGIIHRDLKPANVLLTDEGRPMLLDFNLADDVKQRPNPDRAVIGGTLPYMAPEQIQAFLDGRGSLDARADLFALGVILFELLTGRHPYPSRKGATRDVIVAMLADRQLPPPSARRLNPMVSPATDALVRKCLASNLADRYQSAEQLRVDLDRQTTYRPLKYAPNPSKRERVRKWVRRNPRLTSSGTVALVAAVVVGGLLVAAEYSRQHTLGLEAQAVLTEHRAAFRDAQLFIDDRNRSLPRLDEGMTRLRDVLARYGVPDDGGEDDALAASPLWRHLPAVDRDILRADVGEAFYLLAHVAALKATSADPTARAENAAAAERWNRAAERYAGDRLARAVHEQRADVAALNGDPVAAQRLRADAAGVPAESSRDQYLVGVLFARKGRYRDALMPLRHATQTDPENFSAWFVRGTVYLALEQNELAAMCFGACTALRKDHAPSWVNRGLAYSRLKFFDQACDDYDRAIALDAKFADAYVQRAGAKEALGRRSEAVADYGRALETGAAPARVYFLRAALRDRLGDRNGAAADRDTGFHTPATDEWSWLARAESRAAADSTAALADVEEALKINPDFMYGLQMKAHLLAEKLDRPDDAVKALDRAVGLYPEYVPARAGRAVLHARAGRREAALKDAKDALRRDTKAPNRYQIACVFALIAQGSKDDRQEAFRLLWGALRTGYGLDMIDTDSDLDPLRSDPEFQRLVREAKALQREPARSGAG